MYLFNRQAHLAPGHVRSGVDWAMSLCDMVNTGTDLQVNLWTKVFSAGLGTMSWSTFVPDLVSLEAANDKLAVNDHYLAEVDLGSSLLTGDIDDSLLEVVHGAPDASQLPGYAVAVQAVCANGSLARGMEVGVEIAQRAEAVSGVPTLFVRAVTGPYAQVGWVTGYADVKAMEAAEQAIAADPDFTAFIDREGATVYMPDPSMTQTTTYRRLA